MANILTGMRIVCGLLILVFPAYSKWYFILFFTGGFTDAVDGTVARRLGQETEFGAKFDTAADIVFMLAVIIKALAAISFPSWLLIWTGVIVVIKAVNIAAGFIRQQRFVTVHSTLNRVCGIAVFGSVLLAGLSVPVWIKSIVIIFTCIIAAAAAIHESVAILCNKTGKGDGC